MMKDGKRTGTIPLDHQPAPMESWFDEVVAEMKTAHQNRVRQLVSETRPAATSLTRDESTPLKRR